VSCGVVSCRRLEDMLSHILNSVAPKHPFEPECVTKLRDIFYDHAAYRSMVEPSMSEKKKSNFVHPDISYRAKWKKSGRLLAALGDLLLQGPRWLPEGGDKSAQGARGDAGV
jgi:hypothetical protein